MKSDNSDSDSSEEFYDAEAPRSRGGSLKRRPDIPSINIATGESGDFNNVDEEEEIKFAGTTSSVPLPDEIAKELEVLSGFSNVTNQPNFDENRGFQVPPAPLDTNLYQSKSQVRIDRLEKIRRGASGVSDDYLECSPINSEIVSGGSDMQLQHDSAESSVEGIYMQGSRTSHPFKVIEPEAVASSQIFSPDGTALQTRGTSNTTGSDRRSITESIGSERTVSSCDFNPRSHAANTSPLGLVRTGSRSSVERNFDANSASQILLIESFVSPQGPSSDPKHIPDIVSGHAAIVQCSFGLDENNVAAKPGSDHQDVISIAPPSRPPRKVKRQYSANGRDETEFEDEERTRGESNSVREPIGSFTYALHEKGASNEIRNTKLLKDEVISEHSSEDEKMGSSFVGRIPTGGSSMGSRSFKETSNTSHTITTGGSGGRRYSSQCAAVSGGHSSLGSITSGGGGGISITSGGTGGSNAGTGSSGTGGSGSGKRSIHSSAGGTGGSTSVEKPGKSGISKQMNMFLRTKSDSGKRLSDAEILQQIKVKNLDTGEEMDLVKAEDQLPQSINPLSLHIMRLTSEYISATNQGNRSMDSDTESMVSSISGYELGGKKKTSTMKKLLGNAVKKTTGAAKLVADAAKKGRMKDSGHPPGASSVVGKEKNVEKIGRLATEIKSCGEIESGLLGGTHPPLRDGKALVLKRIQAHKTGPVDFENIQFAQELSSPHLGPIWCMRFSQCGQLLATAGQDKELRIWVLKSSYNYFKEMRNRYTSDTYHSAQNSQKSGSPTNSYENVISDQIMASQAGGNNRSTQIFVDTPFASYKGHTSDLLDVSWSKNYFILTSSMDKTVRLWHISRKECLCCFQHIDFVTAISFHPRNDQFFLSGSLDGKLRLWNIPEKKVALWNEVETGNNSRLITAVNFIQNGKFAVVGTYDGRCIFYLTDTLKYHTMIHVRSSRGKNSQGRKVTGIEPMPGEDKILITSNDSRIRLYDLRDLSLSCKFKGYSNQSSQIKASFSHDGKYITAGSENQCVYIWRSNPESNNLTVRKDRSSHYEAIKAHNAAVTCSVFAPKPNLILEQLQLQQLESTLPDSDTSQLSDSTLSDVRNQFSPNKGFVSSTFPKAGKERDTSKKESNGSSNTSISGYVLISGDYDGGMNVFLNVLKPKHSSLPSASSVSAASN